jgi:hypothetical protein
MDKFVELDKSSVHLAGVSLVHSQFIFKSHRQCYGQDRPTSHNWPIESNQA